MWREIDVAKRELKVKMSLVDRRFYRGRQMSEDAVRCLINDDLRTNKKNRGWKSARPDYVEPQGRGRKAMI